MANVCYWFPLANRYAVKKPGALLLAISREVLRTSNVKSYFNSKLNPQPSKLVMNHQGSKIPRCTKTSVVLCGL